MKWQQTNVTKLLNRKHYCHKQPVDRCCPTRAASGGFFRGASGETGFPS